MTEWKITDTTPGESLEDYCASEYCRVYIKTYRLIMGTDQWERADEIADATAREAAMGGMK